MLVALAHAGADPSGRAVIERLLGRPDLGPAGIDRLRAIIADTGALEDVERMIDERFDRACDALTQAVIRPDARSALLQLADAAANRVS